MEKEVREELDDAKREDMLDSVVKTVIGLIVLLISIGVIIGSIVR